MFSKSYIVGFYDDVVVNIIIYFNGDFFYSFGIVLVYIMDVILKVYKLNIFYGIIIENYLFKWDLEGNFNRVVGFVGNGFFIVFVILFGVVFLIISFILFLIKEWMFGVKYLQKVGLCLKFQQYI